jgi:hypothetical protein
MLYWTYMKHQRKHDSHKMSNTSIYNRWKGMFRRCYNPNCKYYYNYGGRGIKVCKRWFIFSNFYSDMKDGFKKELELDRIDNNGNYSPENCRWVTRKENSRNKRTNRIFNGETATEAGLRIAGNTNIVANRLRKGWSIERAFTTPKSGLNDTTDKLWSKQEKADCLIMNWRDFTKKFPDRTYQSFTQMRFRIRSKA